MSYWRRWFWSHPVSAINMVCLIIKPSVDGLLFGFSRTEPLQRPPSLCMDLDPLSLTRRPHPRPSVLQLTHALC